LYGFRTLKSFKTVNFSLKIVINSFQSHSTVVLKVPLIIYNPKLPQISGKKVETFAELIDLFPTIVDIAELPEIPPCSDSVDYEDEIVTCTEGKSLRQKMLGLKLDDEEFAFSQYPRPGPYPTKSPDSDQPKLREIKIMGYSIRSKRFRYTAWIKFNNKKFKRSKFS
jgi:iduronate 2-sulfatase